MDQDKAEIFARHFLWIIKRRGIDINQLADKSGIPVSSLTRMLGGVSIPNQKAITKLCEAVDMSVDEIIEMEIPHEAKTADEDSFVLTAYENKIIIAYRQLPDDHWLKKAIDETLLSENSGE